MTNQTERNSFIIYRSFIEAIKDLPDCNRLEVFDAICDYALDCKEPKLAGISKTVFTLVKPQLDANYKRFENGKKKKQNRSKTEAKDKQTISKDEANVNDNLNVNVNSNEKSKSKKFIPPTLEEVQSYCIERNSSVNAKDFFDYYNTGNWKDAKGNKVKNWKQKLLTWEKKQSGFQSQNKEASWKYL